jgi:hypothetical protein
VGVVSGCPLDLAVEGHVPVDGADQAPEFVEHVRGGEIDWPAGLARVTAERLREILRVDTADWLH